MSEVFKKKYFVSVQCPFNIDKDSEPEPDISIIEGKARDFKNAIPKTAVLVVEVADTSLSYDRSKKASLYARAEIKGYWIIDLPDRHLEVSRRPIEDAVMFYGFGYAERQLFTEKDIIAPLAKPESKTKVIDLLP